MEKNMKLRKLQTKDAEGMLEWMTDPECNKHFRFNPNTITLGSVKAFIVKSENNTKDCHRAIVNEHDEYLGTISLKNISTDDNNAEYAIALRQSAFGKGIGHKATMAILDIAFNELKLNRVYLNVLPENIRAVALYNKCGFKFEGEFREHINIRGELKNLLWYAILRDEFVK
jgi:diamine N-acetyltransferase